jgi:hypothetical protein
MSTAANHAHADSSRLAGNEAEQWASLGACRVFFGHQSVGSNILAGVEDLRRDPPTFTLRVIESREPWTHPGPALLHFPVGSNRNPLGKMREFGEVVRASVAAPPDMAVLKLCYVDLKPGDDPVALAAEYERTMTALQREFPATAFVRTTIPLTIVERTLRSRVKGLLGTPPWGLEANAVREVFNERLRESHTDGPFLFDVARVECIDPAGRPVHARWRGRVIPCLCPAYSSDRGHLNAVGRVAVAREFLRTLCRAVSAVGAVA